MFSTLNKVILGLIVVVVVAYFLQNRVNNPDTCKNINGLWNAADEVCEKPTEEVIFQSLLKPHPVTVIYPDSLRAVKLDKLEQVDDSIFFTGHFEDEVQAANGDKPAVYERGSVYLDMSKLKLLANNLKGITYFAAPFVTNSQGSGVFTYVGLFSFDFATQEATHLSSELLGNRIRDEKIIIEDQSIVEENVFVQEGLIRVNFKSHAPTQAFSEYPTQSNDLLLQLVALDPKDDQHASFRRITPDRPNNDLKEKPLGMHPSWDVNSDGLNDCEQDGSCDHTIDYTQAKPEA